MGDRDRLPPPPPPPQLPEGQLPPLPQARRVLKDYTAPNAYGYRSPILAPAIENRDFDLKTSTIQMIQANQFSGGDHEDPNSHLTTFLEVCDTFKLNGVSEDAKLLRLFPFSLSGRARDWLRSQTPDSLTTWEELAVAFLNKYFPPSKTAYYRNQITNFSQLDGENLYEAWERYKEYQRLCPHHNLDDLQVFHTFYHGVDGHSRLALDTAAGGAIMDLEPHEGYAAIEKITKNYFMYGSERGNPRRRHERHEVKAVSSSDYDALRKDFEKRSNEVFKLKHPERDHITSQGCDICEVYEHDTNSCPLVQRDRGRIGYEEANYVGGNQGREFNANSYHGQNAQTNYTTPKFSSTWRDHPNFSYKTTNPTPPNFGPKPTFNSKSFPPKTQFQGQQYQVQAHKPYQQVYHPPQVSNEPSGVEAMLAKILAQSEKTSSDFQAQLEEVRLANQNVQIQLLQAHQGLQTHVKMLENQIAQQAESSTRAQGKLSARPEHEKEFCNAIYVEESFKNELVEDEFLERKEHLEAVTLRSGRHLEGATPKKAVKIPPKPIGQARAEETELDDEVPNPSTEKAKERKEELKPYSPPVPFPQRLIKPSKLEKKYEVFTKMLKKLYVYMPFHELIKKAPLCNKFLKEILSKKRTIEEDEPHPLNHECSALFSKQIPQKMGDPGKFTIPCSIGDMNFSSPLADLGASVSVMPLAIYQKLKLNGVKTAKMTLQLADGTTRRPWGLVENVPIKVDKFYIPCDFVVVDMGGNFSSSLILGRPFLATAGFKVDVGKGKLTLKIGGEKVKIEKPNEEQVASVEKKLDNVGTEVAKGKKVDKKELRNMIEPDEDPSFDQYDSSSCSNEMSKNGKAKSSKGEKLPSLWKRTIKQVACNSSKNPD
ncbi:unnamed protein product [Rhodiola kirilowii]